MIFLIFITLTFEIGICEFIGKLISTIHQTSPTNYLNGVFMAHILWTPGVWTQSWVLVDWSNYFKYYFSLDLLVWAISPANWTKHETESSSLLQVFVCLSMSSKMFCPDCIRLFLSCIQHCKGWWLTFNLFQALWTFHGGSLSSCQVFVCSGCLHVINDYHGDCSRQIQMHSALNKVGVSMGEAFCWAS